MMKYRGIDKMPEIEEDEEFVFYDDEVLDRQIKEQDGWFIREMAATIGKWFLAFLAALFLLGILLT